MYYYTVYKVTNQINGKFYIGTHKTKDLDDNYMGSGTYLKYSQKKHGIENFTKEILFVFDNPEEMYAKEAEIVNEDFLAEENTYNLKVGGCGGFAPNWLKNKLDSEPMFKKRWSSLQSEKIKRCHEEGKIRYDTFTGKKHTEETKKLIGKATSIAQAGEGNSQYGTRWVHSLEEKRSKRIMKSEEIPTGWLEGRKIKF